LPAFLDDILQYLGHAYDEALLYNSIAAETHVTLAKLAERRKVGCEGEIGAAVLTMMIAAMFKVDTSYDEVVIAGNANRSNLIHAHGSQPSLSTERG
jgi:hypothetical protein